MKVSIIAAVAEFYAIGKDNDLIWRLPRDMKHFSQKTTGHHVIMGRKNWDSIPDKYRPLPNRTNIVITRKKDFKDEGCIVVNSIEAGLDIARNSGDNEAFIIGGGQIYKLALDENLADTMYITWVHEKFDADTFFPTINFGDWNTMEEEHWEADEKNPHAFTITTYLRKTK
jgi:dihydrofolate reductase